MMAYLHIFEDQSMMQIDNEPSEVDFESVEEGVLTIVKFEDDQFWDLMPDRSWESL